MIMDVDSRNILTIIHSLNEKERDSNPELLSFLHSMLFSMMEELCDSFILHGTFYLKNFE